MFAVSGDNIRIIRALESMSTELNRLNNNLERIIDDK